MMPVSASEPLSPAFRCGDRVVWLHPTAFDAGRLHTDQHSSCTTCGASMESTAQLTPWGVRCTGCSTLYRVEWLVNSVDMDEDCEQEPVDEDHDLDFADPGGRSALRAATADNPRELPCPTCGSPNRLTAADVALGYQCDTCADRADGLLPQE